MEHTFYIFAYQTQELTELKSNTIISVHEFVNSLSNFMLWVTKHNKFLKIK